MRRIKIFEALGYYRVKFAVIRLQAIKLFKEKQDERIN